MTERQTSLRIDIVSDVVCPWCVIGFKQLQRAMDEVQGDMRFELRWQPFELNPDMPPGGENLGEHLNAKYTRSDEESLAARDNLTELGASFGFAFNYTDDMRVANTFKAHQLLHWANENGAQTELEMMLFEAYFTHRRNIDDVGVLVDAAGRAGLDTTEAEAVLREGQFGDAVRIEQKLWLDRGIHAVPAFIIEERYLLSGAQDSAVFVDAFRRAADKTAEE
jgi:predicted DsbA family dithiol-disulfide isomerase